MQMVSTFDANEKVAMKAMTDAHELRFQKSQLEEMLQNAKEEIKAVQEKFEDKLHELSHQLNEKTSQIEQMSQSISDKSSLIEQMSLAIDRKSKHLEHQRKHKDEIMGTMSQEIKQLKAEIKRLKNENNCISEQAERNLTTELEKIKSLLNETEMLIQKGNVERNELVSAVSVARKEAEMSLGEMKKIGHLKGEKESQVEFLQLELEKLKAQCDDLRHSLFEDETEKEKLQKQVFQLKRDLKNKNDALSSIEKKLEDCNARKTASDGSIAEFTSLKERIKLLEVN